MPDPIIHTRLSQTFPLTDSQVDANFVNLKNGVVTAQATADAAQASTSGQIAAINLSDYSALRAYEGDFESVYITGYSGIASPSGIAGNFTADPSDSTSLDNSCTVIVASNGMRWKRRFSGPVCVDWASADTSGLTDCSASFALALSISPKISGSSGATYLISSNVSVPSNKEMQGNGATIKGSSGVVLFTFPGDNCSVSGWDVNSNSSLYVFLNGGKRNAFSQNLFYGDVGHYIFSTGDQYTTVSNNRFDGREIDRIVTSVVFENSIHLLASLNQFTNIENWCIQTRNARHGSIANNICFGTEYTSSVTAISGQTVFNFVMSKPIHLAGIQVDGMPVDSGLTFSPTVPAATPTTNWQVTFSAAPGVGKVVKLIGFRSAENIQVNDTSTDITVSANSCTGSGDSGIILAGGSSYCTVIGNTVEGISYSGISLEGGSIGNSVIGNVTRDCSKVTNAATYSSGILIGGNENVISGNTIINTTTPNPQRYGISVNAYGVTNGGIDGQMKIGLNNYYSTSQPFVKKIYIPNEDATQRRNNIVITDGAKTYYPEKVNLDSAWVNLPANTAYFTYTGFGGTFWVRDTVNILGGTASLRTVAGEYGDIHLSSYAALKNCIVEITFWAKNNSGSSYCTAFLDIDGSLIGSPEVTISNTSWAEYRVSFAATDNINLANTVIRFGGNTGYANVQHINISITAIP